MPKYVKEINGIPLGASGGGGGGIPEPTTSGNWLRTNLGTWVEGVIKSAYDAFVAKYPVTATNGKILQGNGTTYIEVDAPSGSTNLSVTNRTTTTLDVASDTGTDATIPVSTTSLAGLISSTDKTKLDTVATNANVGVVPNAIITGDTKTKITYDSKGLVTGGADANKSDVGLGNVDNTSDVNKPVSTAQSTAINAKVTDAIVDGVTTIAPSQNAVFDALTLKADKQNGLTSGGLITVGTYGGTGTNNDIRVAAATWYINPTTYTTVINTDFLDIVLSSAGNQRYVGLYGSNAGVISKVEGTEAALASYPTTPANNIVIGYVLVGDAVVDTTPDLSGYLLRSDKATQASNTTGTNDTTFVTPLANAVKMTKSANGSDIPSVSTFRSNLGVDKITFIGNSDYTLLATDKVIATNAAFTVSRTFTLPLANTVNAGYEIIIADLQGTVTSVNTLVISRSGSNTINGATTVTIAAAFGMRRLISDGSSKWTLDAGVLRVSDTPTLTNPWTFSGGANFQMNARTLKGNNTGASATSTDLTSDQIVTMFANATANSGTGIIVAMTSADIQYVRLTSGSCTGLGSIANGVSGKDLYLWNDTGVSLIIYNEYVTGTSAADRILCLANLTWANNTMLHLKYDSSEVRWVVVALSSSVFRPALAGTGNRVLIADSVGQETATVTTQDADFTPAQQTSATSGSWTGVNEITISGLKQGQLYYDISGGFRYECTVDNKCSRTPITNTTNITTNLVYPCLEVTSTSGSLTVDSAYVTNNAARVDLQLPSTATQGDVIIINGKGSGGWGVTQNASQQIVGGLTNTTTGVTGYIRGGQYAAVTLKCITAGASTIWQIVSTNPATTLTIF